jgi:glycosyltransferase involved in cell wall biosynthesis
MTHILLIADRMTRSHRTGIDLYYDKMIYWLPRLAPQINFTVVSFGEPDLPLPNAAPNIRHIGLLTSRRSLYLRAFLPLNNPLSGLLSSIDFVHTMMPLPLQSDKRLLTTIFDLTPLLMPEIYPWHSRLIFQRSVRRLIAQGSRFTTISKHTADDLSRLFSIDSSLIYPVHLGVDDEFHVPDDPARCQQVREKYHLPERYFFYVGSMHKRKNLPTALESYAIFKRADTTDTRLVIAGRMELGGERLLKEIAARGLADDVVLPGYVDADDLPFAIAGAVALLYPSLYEGFGLPVIEAMMCGTPVIAARTGSIPEIAGEYALLCEALDAHCFAQMMSRINTNDGFRAHTVAQAHGWAAQFTWRSTATQVLQLYKTLL